MQWFDYPYFLTSLGLLVISMAGFLILPMQRKSILVSGILSIPCSLTTFIYVPEYWNPVRLFSFSLGVEDILFSFSTGMIAWTISLHFYQGGSDHIHWPAIVFRYLTVLGLGIAMIIVMHITDMMVMTQAFVGISITGGILSYHRLYLLPAAFWTGIVFGFFYTVFVAFALLTFPGLKNQWTHTNLCGISILDVPLEEIIWAFVFGTCWTITMAYIINAKRCDSWGHPSKDSSTLSIT
jgi:hypothetical protein